MLTHVDPRIIYKTFEEEKSLENFRFIVWGILLAVIILLGLIGNTLTMVVLWHREMSSPIFYYLRALVITDNLLLVVSFFRFTLLNLSLHLETLRDYGEYTFGIIFIPLNYLLMSLQAINVWIMVVITIDRYTVFCQPVIPIKKDAMFAIGVVVFISFLCNLPHIFAYRLSTRETVIERKTQILLLTSFGESDFYSKLLKKLVYFISIYIIPPAVIIILNALLMIRIMDRRRQQIDENIEEDDDVNITRVLVIISMVFLVCHVPNAITKFRFLPRTYHLKALTFNETLFVFNSAFKFLAYVAFGRKFRKVFLKVFCRSQVVHCEDPETPEGSALGEATNDVTQEGSQNELLAETEKKNRFQTWTIDDQ